MMRMRIHIMLAVALAAIMASAGCKSDDGAQKTTNNGDLKGPNKTTTKEDGYIVERFTLDDDDETDVFKYFEEYPDPDNPDVMKRRLRKKKIDVNSDGNVDVIREYDKEGDPKSERIDVDLDGVFDARNYFDGGQMVRKEMLGDDGESVTETRFYRDGTIIRVERDRNNDGNVDYWEYYEQGTLDRIGKDVNGDGSADQWTRR